MQIIVTTNEKEFIKKMDSVGSIFNKPSLLNDIKNDVTSKLYTTLGNQIQGRGIGKSGKFKPLKPATIKRKGHDLPLVDKGKLRNIATKGGRKSIRSSNKDVTYKFKIVHKAINFLQSGTRKMPARPLVDFTDRQRKGIEKVFWNVFAKHIKRANVFDKVNE